MLTFAMTSFAFALPPTLETETQDTFGNTPTTHDSPIINGLTRLRMIIRQRAECFYMDYYLTSHWIPLCARVL